MYRRAGLRSRRRRVRAVPLRRVSLQILLLSGHRRRNKKAMSQEEEEHNAKIPRVATDSVEMKIEDVSALVDGIWSDDPLLQLESTTNFRKILSSNMTLSTKDLIQSGVVPRFIKFLDKKDTPKLQHEAAWAITNIASDKPELVIGAVPILLQRRAAPSIEQAIWALANVAAGSIQNRDYVLSCGVLLPLLTQLELYTVMPIRRITTWTLATLCNGQPPPPFDQMECVLAPLVQILPVYDAEILKNACWAFCYLSEGSEDGFLSVIGAGLVSALVFLLKHNSPAVITPALYTVGNIVSRDSQQTQRVINSGVLPQLANLLTEDYDKDIKKHACWTISNITAGTEEQVQSVINANLIPMLVDVAQNTEFDVKKEALWAISNATSAGSHDQIEYLVGESCIKPLCDNLLMSCPDPRIISVCLNGLENILKVGEAVKNRGVMNNYCQLIDDEGGQDKIETLRSHDHKEIYEKAIEMLDLYWP